MRNSPCQVTWVHFLDQHCRRPSFSGTEFLQRGYRQLIVQGPTVRTKTFEWLHMMLLATEKTDAIPDIAIFGQVKLIIIDSIAFHFRQDFQDMAQRTRVLAEMAQKLMQLAEDKDLAVSFPM